MCASMPSANLRIEALKCCASSVQEAIFYPSHLVPFSQLIKVSIVGSNGAHTNAHICEGICDWNERKTIRSGHDSWASQYVHAYYRNMLYICMIMCPVPLVVLVLNTRARFTYYIVRWCCNPLRPFTTISHFIRLHSSLFSSVATAFKRFMLLDECTGCVYLHLAILYINFESHMGIQCNAMGC